MICVYQGIGLTDAYLVRDWLERNDIRAVVREALLGALGQVPVCEAYPSVHVADADKERAEEALRVFRGPSLVHPEWTCPKCGEENGPAFGSCWRCGADRVG